MQDFCIKLGLDKRPADARLIFPGYIMCIFHNIRSEKLTVF